jgi:ATP-dependent Lon protease
LNKIEIEDKVIDEIIERTKNFEGIRQIQMYITKIYELIVLDEYTNKYKFEGVFGIKNINLLKLAEKNISHLSLYI